MDINQILNGLIQQVPVIGILLWLVLTQRTEIRDWQIRYMDLNQKLIEVLKDQMTQTGTELRTLIAMDRRRSEYDMREYDRLSHTSGQRPDTNRKDAVREVGLPSVRNDQS